MSNSISRRSLIQWLGAAAATLPLLKLESRARAQGMPRPRRLIVLYTPHGAPAEYFWPKSATDLSSTAGDLSILSPLQKHASRLITVRGIDYVGSDNHYANKDVLTAKGPDSLDTVVARKLGVKPQRLGIVPDYAQSFTVDGYFTLDGGKPIQANPDPIAALDSITGGLMAGGGGGAPAPTGPTADQLRKEALAVTDAELAELRARLDNPALKSAIDKHQGGIKALASATASPSAPMMPLAGCTTKPTLAAVEKVRGKNVWAHENFADLMDAQNAVAAFALRCGLTRVVTLQAGYVNHGVPFTWAGVPAGHHGVSHGARREHAICQRYFAEKFSALLDALDVDDPEDPGRKIIDNTTAFWCTEIDDGNAHTCKSLPLVVAGGGSGYLKTQQYLQLGSVSHTTLLTSLAEAMGVTGVNFGGPGALAEVKA